MNAKFAAVKNHIISHRAKYSAAATLTACVAVQVLCIAPSWNKFLDANNLTDLYYSN